jgi:uncharacterized membrane protein YdbT with pleckstrin-like domain
LKSYVDANLIAGETVLYRTRHHWIVLVAPAIVSGLLAIIALGLIVQGVSGGSSEAAMGLFVLILTALIIGVPIWQRAAAEMAVTDKRVIFKIGLLTRKTLELMLIKVESVGVEQGVFARMLDYGTLVVRGTGGTFEPFHKVAHPLEFRRQVQQQVELSHHPAVRAAASGLL